MGGSHFAIFQWLTHVQMELLLFAATFFAIGLIDEFFVDVAYVWFRLTGRLRTEVVDEDLLREHRLAGPAVLFIPAWKEQAVIGTTIAHVLGAWPQPQLRIFIGCYPNDHDTIQAVENVLDPEERVRVVIVDRPGPTTKAHCLNQLYAALLEPLTPLTVRPGENLSEVAERLTAVRKLEREVASLERKLRTEPQFNRKVDFRRALKTKQHELTELVR